MAGTRNLWAALLLVVFCLAHPATPDKCRVVQSTMMTCSEATADDLPKTTNDKILWILFTKSTVPTLEKQLFHPYPSLTDLHAENNRIETIQPDAFAASKALDWVDLSFNKLTSIPPNLFQNSPKVYYFNVSGNPGLLIPQNEPFIKAPNLQWLLLHQCNIETLYPATFTQLPSLKVLSLADNHLATLPPDLFHPLPNLYSLDLSKNRLSTLSHTLFQPLKYLSLYLADNPFNCDCTLYPTILWAKSRRIRDEVRCAKPDNRKWQELVDMRCPNLVEVF